MMSNQFSDEEKKNLYTLLMQHGFKPISDLDPQLLNQHVPGRSPDEIKSLLQNYKKSSDGNPLAFWITKILKLREHRTTSYEHLYDVFASMLEQKGHWLPVDDDYRQIYLFISDILKGNVPEVSSLNSHSITIVLLLLQNLDRLVRSIDSAQLLACLKLSSPCSTPPTQTPLPATAHHSHRRSDLLTKQLLTLFKFQKIDDFLNPFRISPLSNRLVYESFFK